jgi:hypothetical protein
MAKGTWKPFDDPSPQNDSKILSPGKGSEGLQACAQRSGECTECTHADGTGAGRKARRAEREHRRGA